MMRLFILFLIVSAVIWSCGSYDNKKKSVKTDAVVNASPGLVQLYSRLPNGKYYKRYTGNIGSNKVVANLYIEVESTWDDPIRVSGSYSYCGRSGIIEFADTYCVRSNNNFYLIESTDTGNKENVKQPHWNVQIGGDIIKGKWASADDAISYDIDLKENYDSAYQFEVITAQVSDSARSTKSKVWRHINTSYNLLIPSSTNRREDADFIEQELLRKIELIRTIDKDETNAKNLRQFITISNKSDIKEFKEFISEIDEYNGDDWEQGVDGSCVYNEKGLITFSFSCEEFHGQLHPNTFTYYVCMDVTSKKKISLPDIINVDTNYLSNLLATEARKRFRLTEKQHLSDALLVDTIPVTDNIIVSDIGVSFYYNHYEITSFADGDVCFFIPYTKLGTYLKPEFKNRMQL